jgi:hypothetical protein
LAGESDPSLMLLIIDTRAVKGPNETMNIMAAKITVLINLSLYLYIVRMMLTCSVSSVSVRSSYPFYVIEK